MAFMPTSGRGTSQPPRRDRLSRADARERNRNALLDAAAHVVTETGLEAATVQDIAARAGLTTGAIYSIFGSKRDLLVAMVRRMFADLAYSEFEGLEDSDLTLRELLSGHAQLVHDAFTSSETKSQLLLEFELGKWALQDAEFHALIADQRRTRRERLTRALDGRHTDSGRAITHAEAARLSAALLALEHGLAISTALDGATDANQWRDCAVALCQLVDHE